MYQGCDGQNFNKKTKLLHSFSTVQLVGSINYRAAVKYVPNKTNKMQY